MKRPRRDRQPIYGNDSAAAELSYVWTVFLSSMILTSVLMSLTKAVDRTDVMHGQGEVDGVAIRVVMGINSVIDLVQHYPGASHEQRVDLPKHNVAYVVRGLDDSILVRQMRNNGASIEMVIYNDLGYVITGKVLSSSPYLVVDYQPGSNLIKLRTPFEGA